MIVVAKNISVLQHMIGHIVQGEAAKDNHQSLNLG